jgi:transcriptional regulator with XRE-family HTH domain
VSGAEKSGMTEFGAELKAWRTARGLTQADLAGQIGYSASLVSDIERGDRVPTSDFAQRCDKKFGTPGSFARWCEVSRRGAFPSWFAPIVPHEREAVRIHGWALGAIPGLLQTAAYARSLIRARSPRDDDESIERKVDARMERQEILARPKPPLLHYVIDEGVLRQIIGSPEIMAAQLDKLIMAAESPGIVLQILPFSAGDRAGVEGPIVIFEPASSTVVGYTEFHDGGRIVEGPEDVADLMTIIGVLRAVALSPRDSVTFMKQIRRDLDGLP